MSQRGIIKSTVKHRCMKIFLIKLGLWAIGTYRNFMSFCLDQIYLILMVISFLVYSVILHDLSVFDFFFSSG